MQRGRAIIATKDAGYVAIGYSANGTSDPNSDIYVVKINSDGDTIWTKIIGDANNEEDAFCLLQTKDNGFIISGKIDTSGYLLKLSAEGNLEWMESCIRANSIVQSDEGGYITCSANFIYKSDSLGNKIWQKDIGGELDHPELIGSPSLNSIVQTDEGGYFLAGTKPFLEGEPYPIVNNYIYLVCTDKFGDTLWTKLLRDNTGSASSCDRLPDGNFIVAGTKRLSQNESGACLIKIDPLGNVMWTKIISGENGGYHFSSVHRTYDGGFVAAGIRERYNPNVLLVKTDQLGNVVNVSDPDIFDQPTFILYQNYPNPFNPITKINYEVKSDSDVELKIYDVLGKEVIKLVNQYKNAGKYSVEFNKNIGGKTLNSGVYFYSLRVGINSSIKKMILLK